MAGEMWIRCIDSQFCRYDKRAPSIAIRSRTASATSSTVRARSSGVVGDRRVSASTIRRRPRSASARVMPSFSPRFRTLPIFRLISLPSTPRHLP
jgi:hypothetical protein